MAAPKKNDFWKKRSKHGRDKIFETPKILMEAANEYFEWCLSNPLYETIIQSGKKWEVPKMRAMTITGLCIFLDISEDTFDNYSNPENESYKDFLGITTRIREIIKTQKFEGAAAGFLNANIIARDLGLKEKTENETTHTIKGNNITALNKEEQEKINALLDKFKNDSN